MPHRFFLIGQLALIALVCASWAFAGGGPENVCLVVNSDSLDSMAIANHYMQVRHIPPCNVVYVSFRPDANQTDVRSFREQILRPVFETLAQRALEKQIDYIIYSSDFPWRVSFNEDISMAGDEAVKQLQPAGQWPKMLGTQGSLTGLTYLYRRVASRSPSYASLDANRYMRPLFLGRQTAPTMGFRSTFQFNESGQLVDSGGEQYILSLVLAVTRTEQRRGMSVGEAMAYLSRSVQADGTRPAGKVFFTLTTDVRTTERSRDFAVAQDALGKLGVDSEVISTNVPMGKNNVLGLTCGTKTFSWVQTGSTILPGAICDNLTSWGGDMRPKVTQTALTEFLQHGAAGACGTVVEPFLNTRLLAKFPNPLIHVHYARGCSLAEAFYQSVRAPYQLLIAGDPLCQPFARIPQVRVPGIAPGQKVQGILTLKPEADIPPKTPPKDPNAKVPAVELPLDDQGATSNTVERIDRFELFVDGVRAQAAKPGEPLALDTTKLGAGYHELRIVAVGPAPIFTQGRTIVWVVTANHGRAITASIPAGKVPLRETLTVSANSPGARRIEIRNNGRVLGSIYGGSGSTRIKADRLGRGFNYLRVVGVHGDRPEDETFARPIVLWVE